MDFDPKNDARFQEMLAGIMAGTASSRQGVLIEAEEGEEEMIDKLSFLRVEFFWACCFSNQYDVESRRSAYDAYRAVRDTPAAQRFLLKNPYYTGSIDRALCKVANSIRRDWRLGRQALM